MYNKLKMWVTTWGTYNGGAASTFIAAETSYIVSDYLEVVDGVALSIEGFLEVL